MNPGQCGDGRVRFYFNGIEVFRTLTPFSRIAGIRAMNFPAYDEYTVYPDARAFRPDPVKAIFPGRELDTIPLKSGEKLPVILAVDRRGTRGCPAKEGRLSRRSAGGSVFEGAGATRQSDGTVSGPIRLDISRAVKESSENSLSGMPYLYSVGRAEDPYWSREF